MPEVFGLGAIFLIFLGIALLTIAWKTIKIVPQSSVLLIERLGRFHRVAASGLNIIVPFFESPRAVYWTNMRPGQTYIDLREQFIDLPAQSVISRDNVMITVDSVVYWQITDLTKATYEVNDLVGSLVQLTFTGMRSVIGKLDLDHTLFTGIKITFALAAHVYELPLAIRLGNKVKLVSFVVDDSHEI